MGEKFVFMKHRAVCYNCGENVDQVIKAVSPKAEVVCSNCSATRIFVPKYEEVAKRGHFEPPISCYEVWQLETGAPCKNCGVTGPHEIVIGCNNFSTRCNNCGYTHFYKFDMEYIGQCPIEE